MSNRDYVYTRQRQELDVEGRKVHVVLAQSSSVPHFAERPGVVRVKGYRQSLAIESDGKKGSKGKAGVRARHRPGCPCEGHADREARECMRLVPRGQRMGRGTKQTRFVPATWPECRVDVKSDSLHPLLTAVQMN